MLLLNCLLFGNNEAIPNRTTKTTQYTVVVFANDTIFIFVLGQYLFFSSVPVSVMKPRFLRFLGSGSGTSVLVLTSRYQSLGTRFSGIICIFSHFGTSSVPFRLHFNSKSGGT